MFENVGINTYLIMRDWEGMVTLLLGIMLPLSNNLYFKFTQKGRVG